MMITHSIFSEPLKFQENQINVLILESPTVFTGLIEELISQYNGQEGRFVLSEKFKPINIAKSMDIITDMISLDINSRKIITKLHNLLQDKTLNEYFTETIEIKGAIARYMDSITANSDVPLTYNDDIDICSLFKATDVKIDSIYDNLAEKITDYLLFCRDMLKVKCFVFINLKCFISPENLIELYKMIGYNKIQVLLFENTQRPKLNGERLRIIDKDLCEIF